MSTSLLEERRGKYQGGMGKYKVAVLLLWAIFASCTRLEMKVDAVTSSPLDIEIEAKLKLLNKPAVKSIKSEDGDIIDCVNIYEQPAFDHPALKNHTIQRIPDFFLKSQNSSTIDASQKNFEEVFQTWQKSGSCPRGTVPIRRIQKEDLLRASSLDRFGQKPPELFMNSTDTTNLNFSTISGTYREVVLENRSDAHLVAYGFNFIGAQADINLWNPKVDLPEDFTTAQIWLKAASGPTDFESVEAGWVVNPKLYGDHRSRFFAYWTRDSYKSTGCFDLTCHGFVQTNTHVALGSALEPTSSTYGEQYEINVGIFWDKSRNWWLKVRDDIPIGYWPAEILSSLQHSATLVQWGGQVFSPEVRTSPHTGTGMGSGEPADGKHGVACYMKNVRIKDYSLALKYPEFVSTWAIEPYCYSALNYVKYGEEPVFYFGGPGRKPPYCP